MEVYARLLWLDNMSVIVRTASMVISVSSVSISLRKPAHMFLGNNSNEWPYGFKISMQS